MPKLPDNFETYIAPQIKRRSGYHCEICGAKQGTRGYWRRETFNLCKPGTKAPAAAKVIRITLGVIALDYKISNTDFMEHYNPPPAIGQGNLLAACQRCKIIHDSKRKKRTYKRKQKNNRQQELSL